MGIVDVGECGICFNLRDFQLVSSPEHNLCRKKGIRLTGDRYDATVPLKTIIIVSFVMTTLEQRVCQSMNGISTHNIVELPYVYALFVMEEAFHIYAQGRRYEVCVKRTRVSLCK